MITNTQLTFKGFNYSNVNSLNPKNIFLFEQSFPIAFENAQQRFKHLVKYDFWQEDIFKEIMQKIYCSNWNLTPRIVVSEFESAFLRFPIVNKHLFDGSKVRSNYAPKCRK